MADEFERYSTGLDSPGVHAAIVTPSDGADLATVPRALLIGASGNLRVTTLGGETLTIPNVPVGVLPLRVVRVFSTSTTASDILAIW